MAYLICIKDQDDRQGSLCKIAENENDLNILIKEKGLYKIIEISEQDFNDLKIGLKRFIKYNNNDITFENFEGQSFINKQGIKTHIDILKKSINSFLKNEFNSTHVYYSKWKTYHDQLDTINVDNIEVPLNIPFEKYLSDNNIQPLNLLQLP